MSAVNALITRFKFASLLNTDQSGRRIILQGTISSLPRPPHRRTQPLRHRPLLPLLPLASPRARREPRRKRHLPLVPGQLAPGQYARPAHATGFEAEFDLSVYGEAFEEVCVSAVEKCEGGAGGLCEVG